MELYEYARPGLMAGKKILYVHGFASSGQNGSVRTLRLLMPRAQVLAPDLPVEPFDAMELLRNMVVSEKPDLIVGSSMGAMYAEMLYGVDRILVNPAFQLADTLLKTMGWDGRSSITLVRMARHRFWSQNPSGTFPGGQLALLRKGFGGPGQGFRALRKARHPGTHIRSVLRTLSAGGQVRRRALS